MGYNPWGCKELGTTEYLTHTTLVSLSPFPAESPRVCPSDVPNFYSHHPSILWWFCFSRLSQEPASFHLIALSLLTASPSAVHCCSVAQSCSTLCNPMDCSTPGSSLLHHLPELAQTHVHWVSDAIQPSQPQSPPFPPPLNLSQHQGLFQWVSSSYQVAKLLHEWGSLTQIPSGAGRKPKRKGRAGHFLWRNCGGPCEHHSAHILLGEMEPRGHTYHTEDHKYSHQPDSHVPSLRLREALSLEQKSDDFHATARLKWKARRHTPAAGPSWLSGRSAETTKQRKCVGNNEVPKGQGCPRKSISAKPDLCEFANDPCVKSLFTLWVEDRWL